MYFMDEFWTTKVLFYSELFDLLSFQSELRYISL